MKMGLKSLLKQASKRDLHGSARLERPAAAVLETSITSVTSVSDIDSLPSKVVEPPSQSAAWTCAEPSNDWTRDIQTAFKDVSRSRANSYNNSRRGSLKDDPSIGAPALLGPHLWHHLGSL